MGVSRAAYLAEKSVKWLQEHTMERVLVLERAVHPDVDQAPPPSPVDVELSHHAHTGVGVIEGHVYSTVFPSYPGPQPNERSPIGEPQEMAKR